MESAARSKEFEIVKYSDDQKDLLEPNQVYLGRAEDLLLKVQPNSVALSVWSPPYNVGKDYEKGQSHDDWKRLLKSVIRGHLRVLKPGGFMVINIADILCFPDEKMPRIQAPNLSKLRAKVTREQVLQAKTAHPDFNRDQLASLLGCSEQTIDRRLNGNNIRGGKYNTQTRVQLVGSILQEYAQESGLYLYDRRIWAKDPAWVNSQWHSSSYRAVDDFEYLYVFWKPGETAIDRTRLSRTEWAKWGSRGVWEIPSVRANDIHEAMFPKELPRRCIQLFTAPNDLVLDPFMGSGTTGIAAVEMKRSYIGIEADPVYVKLARNRIQDTKKEVESRLF